MHRTVYFYYIVITLVTHNKLMITLLLDKEETCKCLDNHVAIYTHANMLRRASTPRDCRRVAGWHFGATTSRQDHELSVEVLFVANRWRYCVVSIVFWLLRQLGLIWYSFSLPLYVNKYLIFLFYFTYVQYYCLTRLKYKICSLDVC
jgi:hypothetical protein